MDYRKALKEMIDYFYVDVVEEFKEVELRISQESRFSMLTKKKDYLGNAELMRKARKGTQVINTQDVDIPAWDEATKKLNLQFEKSILVFNKLCDGYVQLQLMLNDKAEGEKVPWHTYKGVYNDLMKVRADMNRQLHDLDVLYTELDESLAREEKPAEETEEVPSVLTYDDIK